MRPCLIIYDCDGVLIDSEALCDRVVSAALARQGWAVGAEECHRRFLGLTFADIQAAAERHLARRLPSGWVDALIVAVTDAMARAVEPIPGAREALEGTATLGLPFRVASNSSRTEMAAKFARTGLADLIPGDRIHSAYDLIPHGKRGKPAPDLFLDAAAAEGMPAAACVVIEDSAAGIAGALAAGMTCLAYAPEATPTPGEVVRFTSMFALPALLQSMRREPSP